MSKYEDYLDHGDEIDWQEAPDLTALDVNSLRTVLGTLSEEEKALSYRRRVVQGRIDLIRAEMVRRGGTSISADELARVLLDPTRGTEAEPGEDPEDPR